MFDLISINVVPGDLSIPYIQVKLSSTPLSFMILCPTNQSYLPSVIIFTIHLMPSVRWDDSGHNWWRSPLCETMEAVENWQLNGYKVVYKTTWIDENSLLKTINSNYGEFEDEAYGSEYVIELPNTFDESLGSYLLYQLRRLGES